MNKKLYKFISSLMMIFIVSQLSSLKSAQAQEEIVSNEFDIEGMYITSDDAAIKGYIFGDDEVVLLLNDLGDFTEETVKRRLITEDFAAYITNNENLTGLGDPSESSEDTESRTTIEYLDEESNEDYQDYATHVIIITHPTYKYVEDGESWMLRTPDQRIATLNFNDDLTKAVDEFDVVYELVDEE